MAQRQERAIASAVVERMTLADGGRRARRFIIRNPTMTLGMAIVLILILIAVFAPLLTFRGPNELDARERFISPSAERWFGTDNIGRDIYSRTLYGARVSIIVGFSTAAISIVAAALLGLVAGYYPKADMVIMRVMDGLMSIPGVLLAIALMALMGGSVQNVIIALCFVETPRAVRLVRGSVLVLKEQMFIDAARAIGAPTYRILARHILPNSFAPLIVQGTFICGAAILIEAYLSFLGAGPPPDVPTWGNIMAEGRNYISRAVWVIFFPGLFLTFTVVGINIAGDGLRDNLDPRLKRRM